MRPSFSSSSLSPFTTRTPCLTCVSEGNPFRRLLIVSKKWLFVEVACGHGTPPFVSRIKKSRKCPRQESNLVLDLRRVACESSTLQGHVVCQYLARESNPVLRFRRPPCVHHTRKACCRVARPGIEPGPTASEAVMRSSTLTSQSVSTPTWNRTRTRTLGGFDAFRYTIGTKSRRLDLHQHHPVYKTGALLRRATSAKAGVQGVEPCSAVLEAACFPEAHSCNQG